MERKITVTGNGRVRVKPDLINLLLTVTAKNKKYDKAVDEVNERIDLLNVALTNVGFEKDSAKTLSYRIQPHYKYSRDRKGTTKSEFDGYECSHRLKIAFELEPEKLGEAIAIISSSISNPNLDIEFTVKDKDAAKREVLRSAAEDAKLKAEALVSSSGGKIGQLLTIEHNGWSGLDLCVKPTGVLHDTCEFEAIQCSKKVAIEPEEIESTDSAVFVWEIQ